MICSRYSNLGVLKFDEYRAGIPIFLLSILFLLTFFFSRTTTNRHKQLGDEQCEYILIHYRSELRDSIAQLVARNRRDNDRRSSSVHPKPI